MIFASTWNEFGLAQRSGDREGAVHAAVACQLLQMKIAGDKWIDIELLHRNLSGNWHVPGKSDSELAIQFPALQIGSQRKMRTISIGGDPAVEISLNFRPKF